MSLGALELFGRGLNVDFIESDIDCLEHLARNI
jgi:hypothetical protein